VRLWAAVLLILVWGQPATGAGVVPEAPLKLTTTLNVDGDPISIALFGTQYRGVRISHIGPRSIAEAIAVNPGDVLLSLNAQNVYSADQADSVLRGIPSGDLEIVFARMVPQGWKLHERRIRYINPLQDPNFKTVVANESASPAEVEQDLLDLMNADRKKCGGLPALQQSARLSAYARKYANDMVRRRFFSHTDPEGRSFTQRLAEAGLPFARAENLANGVVSGQDAQQLFMNEPLDDPNNHRGNILNSRHLYVGIGVARAPDHSLVVVEEFATFSPDQAPAPQMEPPVLDAPPGTP
jgi:uncharacterized protein YkwD